jgi:hypothetical protein
VNSDTLRHGGAAILLSLRVGDASQHETKILFLDYDNNRVALSVYQ